MVFRSFFNATAPLVALLVASLAACGDPPQRVGGFTAPAAAVPSGAPYFAGHLNLTGELADRTQGAVFVAVRAVAEDQTLLVRKYDLGGPGFDLLEDGVRSLHFELGPESVMNSGGPPRFPAALQLWVFFDGDGSVDTREDRVSSVRNVELGDQNIRLQLPEG